MAHWPRLRGRTFGRALRAARGRLEASSSGLGVGVVGARPALSLWGALGFRCPSMPACYLEKPPQSARCPLCAQDFRGTAFPVTCGNFPPMTHGQPQRGEAPSPSRPSPPFSRPSWGWPGRSPLLPGRATSPPAHLAGPGGLELGLACLPAKPGTLGSSVAATCPPWAPVWPEVSGRRAVHGHFPIIGNRDECPRRHAWTGTHAPQQTSSGLYRH